MASCSSSPVQKSYEFDDVFLSLKIQILASNATRFLTAGGKFITMIKANLVNPIAEVRDTDQFDLELRNLRRCQFKVIDWVTLEPFDEKVTCIVGDEDPGYGLLNMSIQSELSSFKGARICTFKQKTIVEPSN